VRSNESGSLKVLHFLLQDIHCCLELSYLEKILPLPLLEYSPHGATHFAGLMNFKGICVPVFDLAMGVGLPREEIYSLNIPILLCTDGTHQLGFIVDKVIGLEEFNTDKIEIQEEFTQSNSPFLGAITLDTRVSLLMNTTWMFSLKLTQEINADYE
jgi:purine-binding chemotaxis protein CheW